MSKVRGVFPLFLATTFGIVNGIWVFQPLLAAQQEGNEGRLQIETRDAAHQSEASDLKIIREAEVAPSRSSATESALKPTGTSISSWWPKMSLWSKAENSGNKESEDDPAQIEPPKKASGGKENT